MTKIFIVIESDGSYDDYWQSNVAAFVTKEAAEAFIKDSKAQRLIDHKHYEKLVRYREKCYKLVGLPVHEPTRLLINNPTDRNILKENASIHERNRQRDAEFRDKVERMMQEYAIKNNIPGLVSYFMDEPAIGTTWSIEELELHET